MSVIRSDMWWRGFRDGVEDRESRRDHALGPNSRRGNLAYDAGYGDGWRIADQLEGGES